MSLTLDYLEKVDLKNLKGEKLEYCMAHIIAELLLIDKKINAIHEVFGFNIV